MLFVHIQPHEKDCCLLGIELCKEMEVFRLDDRVSACDYALNSTKLEIMIEFSYFLFAMHSIENITFMKIVVVASVIHKITHKYVMSLYTKFLRHPEKCC